MIKRYISDPANGLERVTKKSAIATLIWLGFCQKDVVDTLWTVDIRGTVEGDNYKLSGTNYTYDQAVNLTLFIKHGSLFVSEGGLDLDLSVREASISQFPIILYDFDVPGNKTKVWLNLIQELPIAELLSTPAGRQSFCSTHKLPSGTTFSKVGASFSLEDSGLDASDRLTIPAFPKPKRGASKSEVARNLICHQNRINAAKNGLITQRDLIINTRENVNLIFNEDGIVASGLLGIEPCIDTRPVRDLNKIEVQYHIGGGKHKIDFNQGLAIQKSRQSALRQVRPHQSVDLFEPIQQQDTQQNTQQSQGLPKNIR